MRSLLHTVIVGNRVQACMWPCFVPEHVTSTKDDMRAHEACLCTIVWREAL
jgi:hypothetical protein